MKSRKSGAIALFIGFLLIVVFVVGMIVDGNPNALKRRCHYEYAIEQFGAFCAGVWLPAGIIGIPLFLITLVVSLIRERKEK